MHSKFDNEHKHKGPGSNPTSLPKILCIFL